MSLSPPAVRANQAEQHLVVGVGTQHNAIYTSPGAGSTALPPYKMYEEEQAVTTVLSAGSFTFTTVVVIDEPAISTPTTFELASSTVIPVPTVIVPASSSLAQEVQVSSVTFTVVPSSPPSATTTGRLASSSTAPHITTSVDSGIAQAESTVAKHTAVAGAAHRSHGPSGGVIAAIVIILLLAFIGAGILLFRSSQIQKRVKNRRTWTAGLGPQLNVASLLEKGVAHVEPGPSHPPPVTTDPPPVVRDTGEEDQVRTQTIPRKPPPLPYSPVSPMAPAPAPAPPPPDEPPHSPSPTVVQPPTDLSLASGDTPVVVQVTFVPQLPDELPITPGEMLFIQTEFDDGWALCINSSGMRGMVPLECLEGEGGQFTGFEPARRSRRASSRFSVATWS